MPRRRKPSPTASSARRVRPDLRPGDHRKEVIDIAPGDELDDLDDDAFDRRLIGAPERPPSGGTAVGVLLGLGVVLGAVLAYVTGLPFLPVLVIGGVIGAIAGIMIDRRRAAAIQESMR